MPESVDEVHLGKSGDLRPAAGRVGIHRLRVASNDLPAAAHADGRDWRHAGRGKVRKFRSLSIWHPPFRDEEKIRPLVPNVAQPQNQRIQAVVHQVLAIAPVDGVDFRRVSPVHLHRAADEVAFCRRSRRQQLIALSPVPVLRQLVLNRVGAANEGEGADGRLRRHHRKQIRRADGAIQKIGQRLPRIPRTVTRRVKSIEIDDEEAIARIGGLALTVGDRRGVPPIRVNRARGEGDELEGLDRLRLAVLEDLEVLRRQPLDEPVLAARIDVDVDEVRVRAKDLRRLLRA